MTLPAILDGRLRLPVIGAPMFLLSQPALVLAQCRAGIVGAFPSLNARTPEILDQWLGQLNQALTPDDAPFAVNLIVHKSNRRLEQDLELCLKHKVRLVITSLGAQPHVYTAVAAAGGFVFHDVTTPGFARKALDKGAHGLVAVAAGAGGHAGTLSPFALIGEIRRFFAGPLALSGAIATGAAIRAAELLGADLAYIGSAFIATDEAAADPAYKQMVVACGAEDIAYSSQFTGIAGNYLKPSIRAAGMDPDALPTGGGTMDLAEIAAGKKAWRDVWGCGQGIGAIAAVTPVGARVRGLIADYRAACDTPAFVTRAD